MNIIVLGNMPEDKIYRFTCHHCKTIFEIKLSEGKVTHDQRSGSYLSYYCPLCVSFCSISI